MSVDFSLKALLVLLLATAWPVFASDEYDVVGDPETNVYLLPNCAGYNELMSTQMRRHFKSLWDAEDSGYVRAADCNPVLEPKPQTHVRTATTYLPPPPPKEEEGQNCLIMEDLDAKKNGGKESRVVVNWQTRVQNICSVKILSAVLFQAVDSNREKIFERAALLEVGEEQFSKVSQTVTMPSRLYNSTARFQIAVLWEEPVHVRPKHKPPVEEENE